MNAPPARPGLMIIGAMPQCGKTVLTAGLAAALGEEGFRVQAYKPLAFGPDADQAFLNKITQQFLSAPIFTVPSAWDWDTVLFNKLCEQIRQLEYPFLLETPGSLTQPWRLDGHRVTDALTLAQDWNLPVLLCIAGGKDFLSQARLALAYLKLWPVTLIGFIRTFPQLDLQDEALDLEATWLAQQFNTAFLGDLPYSPSVSVAGLQQGNLIRLTQDHIDLLPIQMGMGLTVMSML